MNSILDNIVTLANEVTKFGESCSNQIEALSKEIINVFLKENKILICGNGGSAADAQHFAAEIVSSFGRGLVRRALPALALTVDSSIITAISNDFNYDLIFSRQVEALGKPGDLLLAISTSGESKNCINAVETAKNRGLRTAALTKINSTLHNKAETVVAVPLSSTQSIQTCHLITYHIISEKVDGIFDQK